MRAWLPALALLLTGAAPPPARVPFVGCASDGQVGPQPAPRHRATPRLAPALASRLAYYASNDLAVLGPRGWHCFGLYGSNGSILIVTPAPHGFHQLDHVPGPAIQLSLSFGGTSGRFAVAELIARLFPARMDFARQVAAEGIMAGPLPSGPYPADRLERRGPNEVRYLTPGGRDGLGTENRLALSAEPVQGLVLLLGNETYEEPDALKLDVRLPGRMAALVDAIIDDVRRRP
jgi:hypothetical protein